MPAAKRLLQVLDPQGRLSEKPKTLAPRLKTLKGKVIGLLSSGSGNGTDFLQRLDELLRQQYGVKGTLLVIKEDLSNAFPEAQMKKLLDQCDAVIAGCGVGGSNTLSLMVDAAAAEIAGKPGVAVIGSEYQSTARAKARFLNFVSLDFVVFPSPMGGPEPARQKAEGALKAVVTLLTESTV